MSLIQIITEQTMATNKSNSTSRSLNENSSLPTKLLNGSATIWFTSAVLGQWIFVYYILKFYGGHAITGNFSEWNNGMPNGHVPGDSMGNIAVSLHLLFAVIIIGGGALQLIPKIRSKFPRFHRVNGRIYIYASILTSIAGIYMIWTRGTVGGLPQHIGVTVDAVLIITFGILSIRHAVSGNIVKHREWALRMFMAVSAVWFYRVILMFWLSVNNGPVGFDFETFRGPFLTFLAFGQYLVPLLFLELYLYSRRNKRGILKTGMAIILFLLTLAMALGIFAATNGLWDIVLH